jgi:hypothetical protein
MAAKLAAATGPAPPPLLLPSADAVVVRQLLVRTIVGVDNWERKKKQDIVINLRLYLDTTAAGRGPSPSAAQQPRG